MTISNEPGYYEEGAFGIRIENVCVTLEASTQYHFGGRRYCKFETGIFDIYHLHEVL
jgi:Xaa-Pro aminopeptidase